MAIWTHSNTHVACNSCLCCCCCFGSYFYCYLCNMQFIAASVAVTSNCHPCSAAPTATHLHTLTYYIIHCATKPRVKTAKDNKDNILKSSRLTQTQQSLSNQLPDVSCQHLPHRLPHEARCALTVVTNLSSFPAKESQIVYCLRQKLQWLMTPESLVK